MGHESIINSKRRLVFLVTAFDDWVSESIVAAFFYTWGYFVARPSVQDLEPPCELLCGGQFQWQQRGPAEGNNNVTSSPSHTGLFGTGRETTFHWRLSTG
jgi:hypothetical protein